MKVKQKVKSRGGFSLAETLLAVLILLLVSGIVANGMPTVRNVYNNVIVGSNAQLLLSTMVTALRNELGTAYKIRTQGNEIIYHSAVSGLLCLISNGSESDDDKDTISIRIRETGINDNDIEIITEEEKQRWQDRRLVSKAASNGNLYVTYNTVTYADRVVTFTDIEVKREDGGAPLASLPELKIRTI